MSYFTKLFLVGFVLSFGLVSGAFGQPTLESPKTSLGIRVGYALSAGDWNKVRFLQDVTLFKGQLAIGGDLEFRLSDRLSLALDGAYHPLSGSDWEAYARERGDTLSVSASMGYVGIVLRPYLKVGGADIIKLEAGPVMIFRNGSESYNGTYYTYDFFNSLKFGGEAGIEYGRMIGENVAASLRVAGIIVPSGVEYADGESRTVIALPLTLGLRWYL